MGLVPGAFHPSDEDLSLGAPVALGWDGGAPLALLVEVVRGTVEIEFHWTAARREGIGGQSWFGGKLRCEQLWFPPSRKMRERMGHPGFVVVAAVDGSVHSSVMPVEWLDYA